MIKIHFIVIFLSFFLFAFINSVSQSIQPDWVNYYSDNTEGGKLIITDALIDNQDNLFMTGYCLNEVSGYDIVTCGFNSAGDTLFYEVYNNSARVNSRDIAQRIHQDHNGNLVVVGTSLWRSEDEGDVIVLKYSPAGKLLWNCIVSKEGEFYSSPIASDVDGFGNIYILAFLSESKLYLEKLSPEGQIITSLLIHEGLTPYYYFFLDVANNAIYRYNSKEVQKADLQGEVVWDFKTLFKQDISVFSLVTDKKGFCYIAGVKDVLDSNGQVFKALKISQDGTILWEKEINCDAVNSSLVKAIPDYYGGVFLAYQNISDDYKGYVSIVHIANEGDVASEWTLRTVWGRWKELKDFFVDINGNVGYSVLNYAESPNYSNNTVKHEIGKIGFDGTLKWSFESLIPDNVKLSPVKLLTDSSNNTQLISIIQKHSDSYGAPILNIASLVTTYSESGSVLKEKNMSGNGVPRLFSHSMTQDQDGNLICVAIQKNLINEIQLVVVKYDNQGVLNWDFKYKQPNGYGFNIDKVNVFNNNIKLFLTVQGYKDGSYEQFVTVLTIDSQGNLIHSTDLSVLSFENLKVSNCIVDDYYIQYWSGNNRVLERFNAEDQSEWRLVLNDDSFINEGFFQGIDASGSIYLTSPTYLYKVSKDGEIIWMCFLSGSTRISQGMDFFQDNSILFWYNEKVGYYGSKLKMLKINPNGNTLWEATNDTIVDCYNVITKADGGLFVFGQIDRTLFGTGFFSVMVYDSDGQKKNHLYINEPGYYDSHIQAQAKSDYSKENLFIPGTGRILKIGSDGTYKGTMVMEDANISNPRFVIKSLVFQEENKGFVFGILSNGTNTDIESWSLLTTFSFIDNQSVSLQNSPPTIISEPDSMYYPKYSFQYPVIAQDDNLDPFIYSIESESYFFSIDAGNGFLRSYYSSIDRGVYPLTLRVTDPYGAFSEQTVDLRFGPDNIPLFYSTPIDYSRAGSDYVYQVKVVDVDEDAVSFSLSPSSPSWLSIDENSGLISGIPPQNLANTSVDVEIMAYEKTFDHTISQRYTLYIDKKNESPSFTNTPPQYAYINKAYEYLIQYSDPDNDLCTVEVLDLPSWMHYDKEKGRLYGTPVKEDFYNSSHIHLILNDGFGGLVDGIFTVDIEHPENNPPVFTTPPILQSYATMDYVFRMEVDDPDEDEVMLSLLEGPSFGYLYNNVLEINGYATKEGEYKVKVLATDYYGLSTAYDFLLLISPKPKETEQSFFIIEIQELTDEVDVSVRMLTPENVRISVYDSRNNPMTEAVEVTPTANCAHVNFDWSLWPSGDYFIKICSVDKSAIKKFSKN